MSRNPIISIVAFLSVVFLVALGVFYVQEGSFAGAGAKMDETLVKVGDETAEAVENTGEATKDFIDDMTDGNDSTPWSKSPDPAVSRPLTSVPGPKANTRI